MQLKQRIKQLEQKLLVKSPAGSQERQECEHPPSMLKLYRVYPATGYSDRRLVTKGHCNACGFDDYLWSFYALTEEQEERRQSLDFWECMAYELELLESGLIRYTVFPPSPEVQIKFTGRIMEDAVKTENKKN